MNAHAPDARIALRSELFWDLIDGLMLGHGEISPTGVLTIRILPRNWSWGETLKDELARWVRVDDRPIIREHAVVTTPPSTALVRAYDRWYVGGVKRLPAMVRLTPRVVALWYAARGTACSRGYALRLTVDPSIGVEGLETIRDSLHGLYGWEGRIYSERYAANGNRAYPRLRFARSGDRVAIRQAVVALGIPACMQYKLAIKTSGECSPSEAKRRRAPFKINEESLTEIRVRAYLGEAYARIASDFHCSPQTIGKIVRGERWTTVATALPPAVPAARETPGLHRRYRRPVRLNAAQLRVIAVRLAANEPQSAIAHDLNVPQSRISWLKRKGKLPRV